jgi:putative ABC transport system ATP-binding protein
VSAPLIDLQGAAKAYGPLEGGYALRPTDLSIGAGDYVAIVGKSASAGQVRVEGQDLARLSENGRALWRGGRLGIVFQFYQLLPSISVLDNLLLAMSLAPRRAPLRETATPRARALALLERVGVAGLADRLPGTLSGGQQQRAAIARALANDPPLLLLDEPTGSIDSDATLGVLAVLDDLHRRGSTLVVVTHDADVAARAGRRITLRDGAVAGDEGSA